MNFEELIGSVGVYAASFVVGFVSGLVPFVNSELYLLLVSPMVSRPALVPIALLSALGQMGAKLVLFYAGRGVFNIPFGRHQKRIDKVKEKFQQWENRLGALILLSAFAGIPPFYAVSVVVGGMKLNVVKFGVLGYIGRAARFTIIVYFPQLVMRFVH